MERPVADPEHEQAEDFDWSADQDAAGEDLTLIRWFLDLSVDERLRAAENFATEIQRIWEENGVRPVH